MPANRTDVNATVNYNNISYIDMSEIESINQSISEDETDELDGIDGMDEIDEVRTVIKDNIDYDALCSYIDRSDQEKLDELVEIMVEAYVMKEDIELGGRLYPYQLIRSRFEKYNMFTMQYVLDALSRNTTEIKNVKSYLLVSLLNAPLTISNNYRLLAQVKT